MVKKDSPKPGVSPRSRAILVGAALLFVAWLVAVAMAVGERRADTDDLRAADPTTTTVDGAQAATPEHPGGDGRADGSPTSSASTAPAVPAAPGACAGSGRGGGGPARGGAAVQVDGATQFQVIEGFGTTVRLFDDPHLTETFDEATARSAVVIPPAEQDAILDRLHRDLKLNRVRPATDGGVEVVNDNADPEVTDLSKFNFAWKRNDGHVDYYKRVAPRGATNVFLSPVSLEPWQKASTPAEYAEWAMVVIRRWRSLGVELPYFSVVNEPGGAQGVSGEYIRDVIKIIGPKLQAEGFRTKMMVPDDINPTEALDRLRTVLADPAARSYVGVVAYHLYGPLDARSEIAALAAQYGLPVWMTEYYEADAFAWANTVHELIDGYNVGAVDYLWGFFGQWAAAGDQLITVNYEGSRYLGYTLNKQYFTFGQFTRFVAPGSRRVAATSSDGEVKVTAFVKDRTTTVVAINNSGLPKPAQIALVEAPCSGAARGVRTSASESWADLPAAPVENGRWSATLAPRSVTTFVTGS